MCATSYSGIPNFRRDKDISAQDHFEMTNIFSTQRLRGSEDGKGKDLFCYGNKTASEAHRETEDGMSFCRLLCFSAFSVVVTKKMFAVVVAVL